MDEIRKIPPVTRTLLGAVGLVTLPCMLALMTPYRIMLSWPIIMRRYELHRILTAFFFGGQGLPFLFDSFLLFRNSSDLELSHFARRTADYVWSLLIMGAAILATNYPLKSPVLFSPMLNALTYLWARTNPDGRVSFFGFITIPAPWLPYAYLFLDLVRGGPGLMIQSATGIISAHLYWLLAELWPASNGGRGPRLLGTPTFLRSLLPDSQDPTMAGQNIGDRQGRRTAYGSAWNAATTGQRLGDGGARQQGPGLRTSIRRSSPAVGVNGLLSWRRPGASSASAGTGPDREAMLAAAERRLRSQQASSIVGRNQAAAASTSSSSSSAAPSSSMASKPQTAGTGSNATASSSINARASNPSATAAVRRTAAGSGQSHVVGFEQLRDRSGAANDDGEEDHSSSGGRVAEKRRKAPTPDSSEEEKVKEERSQGYRWGETGRKLGN